jgi:hypothetical protein
MKTVREEWDTYAKAVLPGNAMPVQATETRRAFYAGAYAMMIEWREACTDERSDEDIIAYFKSRISECEKFYKDVSSGKA